MARYNLDEMALMAKERRIDSSNLQDVMESLADYNIDNDTVRYILEELVASENMPKQYRQWIDDVLVNYDALKESDIVESKQLEKLDVEELIVDKAPDVTPNASSESPSTDQGNNGQETLSAAEEVLIVPVEKDVTEQLTPKVKEEQSPILPDVSIALEEAKQELNTAIEAGAEVDAYIIDDSYAQVFSASANYQNNNALMKTITDLANIKGINIIESKVSDQEPATISLELTPESKPYLDNLLLQLYGDNKNHLNIALVKDDKTGKEMLVMKVDDKNLSHTEVQRYSQEMLTSITEIIETTDKEKNYESLMSPELRKLRDKFHGDEKDVVKANDIEIVTSKEDGQNSYHIVADTEVEAKEAAKDMGVEIRENHGGGVFEIDDRNIPNMDSTKIGEASKNVNYTDEVKEIDENGISDLNINYNNTHYYGKNSNSGSDKIRDFLEESNQDYATISRVTIENYGNQRVVSLSDTNGYHDTVVINEGTEFDRTMLPEVAEKFSKDCEVSGSKTYEENGTVGYFGENDKNTQLVISGSNENTMSVVENRIENNKIKEESMSNTNNKTYSKTLGTYPTRPSNYKEAANTSFVTLLVFTLVVILGIAVIYIVFGG